MKPKDEKTEEDIEEDEELEGQDAEDRKKDYSHLLAVKEQLDDLYPTIVKGYDDKDEQNRTIDEAWDAYNCVINEYQMYNGTSQAYVPLIHDAVNARATRLVNMLFPSTDRFADIVTEDGNSPHELIGLLDYYCRTTSLRENVVPAMIRGGDIGGNYDLYVEWVERKRHITAKKQVAEITAEGEPVGGSPTYDDMEYEEVVDAAPQVSVIDTRDLLILPSTCQDIDDADIVVVCLRYSKSMIKAKIADGTFLEEPAETLIKNMSAFKRNQQPDTGKKAAKSAGVQMNSKGNKQAFIYQVWTRLKIKGERRMMVTHFGGENLVLGCKRNPNWNDRVPILHQPVECIAGSINGRSQVSPILPMQYAANDAVNMGLDSAQYALCPITLTDPEKNPRVGSMVLAMAAIWETSPKDTQFATMPPIWKDAFQLVGACKDQIMQSLGVNPAMMPNAASSSKSKPSQAQVAQEQQVALASISDAAGMVLKPLNKLLEWFYDMDYQYRTEDITVKKFGQFGLQADMDQVPPSSTRQRLFFRWYGMEATKSAQQVQQMISWANVLKQIPPQALNGRKLDLVPMLEFITEVTCGPRIAPRTLVDQRHQLTMPIENENELLEMGFPVQVQPMDDDMAHIQGHMLEFKDTIQQGRDTTGNIRLHIMEHMKAAQEKAKAAQGQPALGGAPQPGGPRPGAQAQMPTGPQQPAGAISPDGDPNRMPRKAGM